MAENENVAVQPEGKKGKNFKASIKEWFRKKIVALKQKPQNIPLLFMAVTTIFAMLALYRVSRSVMSALQCPEAPAIGICIFINTLLSLLSLVSFLNAFPKRKKPNIFFIVLVFVMIAAMVGCLIGYFIQMQNAIANLSKEETIKTISSAQPYVIVNIVLLGLSALVFALLPVYSRLIKKIDTSVKLESATENMQGNIDITED